MVRKTYWIELGQALAISEVSKSRNITESAVLRGILGEIDRKAFAKKLKAIEARKNKVV